MKSVATLAAGSLLASVANAQVVQWDIQKREDASPMAVRRRQSSSTYQEVVTNDLTRGGYFANVLIGTPGQNLTLQLDTGSSDIWVPSSSASVCSSSGCSLGSFSSTESSTFEDLGANTFSIAYVDGSSSKGDYFTDTFVIGGATIPNMTMGLGKKTDIPYGLVGVGYALNEAAVAATSEASSAYENLPVQMQTEGLIATNAYSLWLNDLDASTVSILFGGIDTDKYEGDLTRIDIIEDPNTEAFTSFLVLLTSLSANSSSGSDALSSREFPIPVVLDSGTTLSYLPTDIANQIWKEVGAYYDGDAEAALLPCSMENSQGTFEFGFAGSNGPKISIDMSELVLSLGSGSNTFPSGNQYAGQEACQFGIQNFSSDPFLLGDTFLRSAYVVYDLENNQLALAKTDFNATSTNIIAFPSKGAVIPSATLAANQVTSTAGTGTLTTPAYKASAGFADSASTSSTKNAASTTPAFQWAQLSVMGATVVFMMAGSGLFLI